MSATTVTVEVDVAIARPPTPANTRQAWVTLAIDPLPDGSDEAAQVEVARMLAARWVAQSHSAIVMPLAARVVAITL